MTFRRLYHSAIERLSEGGRARAIQTPEKSTVFGSSSNISPKRSPQGSPNMSGNICLLALKIQNAQPQMADAKCSGYSDELGASRVHPAEHVRGDTGRGYVLSSRGARKITSSGFEQELFYIDDFVNAINCNRLHCHFNPAIENSACVQKVTRAAARPPRHNHMPCPRMVWHGLAWSGMPPH